MQSWRALWAPRRGRRVPDSGAASPVFHRPLAASEFSALRIPHSAFPYRIPRLTPPAPPHNLKAGNRGAIMGKKTYQTPQVEVSVLVTAHNEAERIQPCLRAILEQDYPMERVEIVLVDDRSTDGTSELALALGYPRMRVLRREGPPPEGLTARQAALDLGLREARGEVVLVTDASGRVPHEWILELVGHMGHHDGAVTGPLIFAGGRPFLARLQTLDALVALTLHRWANRHGHPTGLLGANMAIRREAYLETGGFPAIGFSLAEDLELGEALTRADWSIRYLTEPAALKRAEGSLGGYLRRVRRRILNMPAPVYRVGTLLGISNLALLGLTLFGGSPLWAALLLIRYVAGLIWLSVTVSQYAVPPEMFWVPFYEPIATLVGCYATVSNLVLRRWTWGGVVYRRPAGRVPALRENAE